MACVTSGSRPFATESHGLFSACEFRLLLVKTSCLDVIEANECRNANPYFQVESFFNRRGSV